MVAVADLARFLSKLDQTLRVTVSCDDAEHELDLDEIEVLADRVVL